jgi:hypothetical protein
MSSAAARRIALAAALAGFGCAGVEDRKSGLPAADSAIAAAGAPAADTVPARAPRYLSLLIGVGNYRYANEWRDLTNLAGPRNDVLRMQHALQRWGFARDSETQRVLLDAQASKAAIASAFEWLASQATDSADVVVIYYSGHGSWAPDAAIDSVRRRDEHLLAAGDGYDEALVPWDARDPHNPRHLVLDDEIGAWLDRFPTGNVTLIVDACFSGTITRGSPDPESATAPRARGPRPPAAASLGASGGLLDGESRGRRMRHTLITAASAWEIAYEKTFYPGGVAGGILTRHLTEALESASSTTRFDELLRQVRTRVGENQTPQLEGDRSARLFKVGAGVVVPERGFALVRTLAGRRVQLDIGAVHGVRTGSTYDVYRPSETRFRAGRLAQVRVDSVLETTAFATPVVSVRIPAGARAVLSRVPAGAMQLDRLSVYVDPSARAMRDSLRSFDWVRITSNPARAMAEVRERDGVYQVLVQGQELPPLPRESGGLCERLRRGFSIAALDLVRNDRPPAELRLDVRLLPAGATPARTSGSVDTAYAGELYDIWVWVELPREMAARSTLYLSVAVAGYTSSPTALSVSDGPPSPLTREQLNVPLRLLRDPVRLPPATGIEQLKVVVNSDPFDFRELMNTLPECAGPRGGTARGPESEFVVTGWTASERRIEIHPPRR